MSFIRAYLRASTKEQDANRAYDLLVKFAEKHNRKICQKYIENESGRTLYRPELMRLIDEAHEGDIILIESIDRLTRLTPEDWDKLDGMIKSKGLQIVSEDLSTSHIAMNETLDSTTQSILKAVNKMMIEILASIACKDYEMRRARSAQGIEKAQKDGKYKGRRVNTERNERIQRMIQSGMTTSDIQASEGCSRTTISKIKNELEDQMLLRNGQ
jgi:DNA invertase Pin-like site-specific DNA recombinase